MAYSAFGSSKTKRDRFETLDNLMVQQCFKWYEQ